MQLQLTSTAASWLVLVAAAAGCGQQAQPRTPVQGYLTGEGGARIFYEVVGSGDDTVVVIHGGPGAGLNDIKPDVLPLTKPHVVIFYDQRGGGRSELPKDTTQLGPRYFVGDLEAVRKHFRLDQMNLLAHSFGAIVVAEYLRAHPHRVARMVFHSATGPNREEAARYYQRPPEISDTAGAGLRFEILRSLMEGRAADPVAACREYEALDRRLGLVFAGRKGSECNMPEPAVRYYFHYTARLGPDAFGNWDYTRSLASVRAPLLIIHGERNERGLAMQRSWVRAVPNARLLLVPGAGGSPHAERPDVVFAAIDEFFAGRWPENALASE
jgi:proline iminopeptidase